MTQVEADRQRHDHREREREQSQLELGDRQFDHLFEAADLLAAGDARALRLEDEFDRAAD